MPTTFSWRSIFLIELDSERDTLKGNASLRCERVHSRLGWYKQLQNRKPDFSTRTDHWTSCIGSRNKHCGAKLYVLLLSWYSRRISEETLSQSVVVVHARTARSRGYEARRGAGFLCQLAGADLKRPLGIFSNSPELQRDLRYDSDGHILTGQGVAHVHRPSSQDLSLKDSSPPKGGRRTSPRHGW